MTASRLLGMRKRTLTNLGCHAAGRGARAAGVLCLVVCPSLLVGARVSVRRRRGRLAIATDRRRSVAREMHDGLAQELAFIASRLQQLDRTDADAAILVQVQVAAQRALLEARLAIEALRAPEDAPFEQLLTHAVALVQERFDVTVTLDVAHRLDVDDERGTALLRILGQAMTNAIAHGGARHMTVRLQACDEGLSLRVDDDGCGFDASRTAPGWGLTGMRERAELLGGRFSIASLPGRGAAVEVTLP